MGYKREKGDEEAKVIKWQRLTRGRVRSGIDGRVDH